MDEAKIKSAVAHFEALVREQYERSDRIKADKDFIDYDKLDKIIIGVCGGDGIGPIITKESARVLEYMLADDVKAGKVEFRVIDGLTIETAWPRIRQSRTTCSRSSKSATSSSRARPRHHRQATRGRILKART